MTATALGRAVEPIDVEALLGRLEAVRPNGEGRWMGRCPAHGDKRASLSVRAGDDGRILLHCFAGCEFTEIVAALDLRPEQLFPPSDRPWRPRPRPNPDAEALAFLRRLQALHTPPPADQMRRELQLVGEIIAGGTSALRDLPPGFSSSSIRTFSLRLLFEAAQRIGQERVSRRWFSVYALSRVIDQAGARGGLGPGYARANRSFFWARLAVATAREERA